VRLEPTATASDHHRADPGVHVYEVGNTGGHHMNDSYAVRPLATPVARPAARTSTPRMSFFSRFVREPQRQPPAAPVAPSVKASIMAGLSRDGTKRGANRVGTWLSHVEVDNEAIETAAKDVEVDDWRVEGSMVGID
ncbi:hypothetical protein P280DRAFT_369890, partial [Massarina eburnea CBS 473.64]